MNRRNFISLFCLVLSACTPATQPPSATLTPTLMVTLATPTKQPSNTPAATETDAPFIPMPTSTYMAPTPLAGANYRLKRWTPALANAWIETLRKYPDSLDVFDRGYHDFGYYLAYDVPAFAEQEAQLRFPRSGFTKAWAWDASYSMAQYGDSDTLESYANLIAPALNTGATNISQLESWFKEHETRMTLKVSLVADKSEGYVLQIADNSDGYGGYLWLVKEQGKFSAYPLPARGGYGDFKASSASGISFAVKDVTGDGIAEIITTHQHFPGSGDALTTGFNVFDISHGAPNELYFAPELSSGSERKWSVIEENGKGIGLAFDFTFDRMTCPFIIHHEYRWNGKSFDRTQLKYPDTQQIIKDAGARCLDQLVSLFLTDLRYDDPDSLKSWDKFVVGWPYSDRPWWPNDKNLPDERDKGRFIAGLYLALNGHVDTARQQMGKIIETPVVSDSSWIVPAKTFLATFHAPSDLPKTCLALKLCSEFIDVDVLIKQSDVKNNQDAIDFLSQVGFQVTVASSLDINNDGLIDQLINIATDENVSPWLLVAGKDQYQAVSLAYYANRELIKSLESQPALEGWPVFRMETNDGVNLYTIEKDSESSEIYVSRLCDNFRSTQIEFEYNLLHGTSPVDIAQKASAFLPKFKVACQDWSYGLGRAQYVLGLAYELSGDLTRAAENYYAVWQLYPQSPFAYMAHFKLEVAP